MGRMTLEEFRDELNSSFGDRGLGNTRLDRWINFAYLELASMVDFEGLKIRDTFDTVASTYNYDLPASFLGMIAIADSENKRRLIKRTDKDILLWDHTVEGKPEYWARRGTIFVLYPTPDDVYTMDRIYTVEPTKLTTPAQVTVFPAIWDQPLLMLAQHYGHLSLGDSAKAASVLRSVMSKIGLSITDESAAEPTPQAGLQVAWDESDLTVQG